MRFEECLEQKHSELVSLTESAAMAAYRKRAFENFKSLGFPTRKNEDWKYTSVQAIREAELAFLAKAEEPDQGLLDALRLAGSHNIVLVNGALREDLSDSPQSDVFIAKSLYDNEYAKYVAGFSYATAHENAFTYLNQAFATHMTHITVDPATDATAHLHIIHITTGTQESQAPFINPRLSIRLADRAGLNLTESFVGDAGQSFCNSLTDMDLGCSSTLRHLRIFGEGAEALHVGTTRWHQKKDSSAESLVFSYGNKLLRHDLHISLTEEGSFSSHKGLYLARDDQHVDHHSWIEHLVGNCQTQQHYKGILDDKARGVFNGKVVIHRDAQKADSQQLNNNLILSRGAEVDSKPELEVYADDVKATHGSTTGQLDEEEVLYLQTRGISRAQAVQMISRGFAMELILSIESPEVREYAKGLVQGALQRLHIEGAYDA